MNLKELVRQLQRKEFHAKPSLYYVVTIFVWVRVSSCRFLWKENLQGLWDCFGGRMFKYIEMEVFKWFIKLYKEA